MRNIIFSAWDDPDRRLARLSKIWDYLLIYVLFFIVFSAVLYVAIDL